MITQNRFFRKLETLPVLVDNGRPKFGKLQIQNLDQLYPGRMIRIRNTDNYNIIVTVKRGPYKECGSLKLDFEFHKGRELETGTIFLADHSVIRDQNGNWNTTNWLEKV